MERRGLALEIEQSGRPEVARTAEDAVEAATIIESWVREDVTAPLLEHVLEPEEARQPVTPDPGPGASATAAPVEPAVIDPAAHPRPFVLGAGAILGLGSDGSTWSGFDVRGSAAG